MTTIHDEIKRRERLAVLHEVIGYLEDVRAAVQGAGFHGTARTTALSVLDTVDAEMKRWHEATEKAGHR